MNVLSMRSRLKKSKIPKNVKNQKNHPVTESVDKRGDGMREKIEMIYDKRTKMFEDTRSDVTTSYFDLASCKDSQMVVVIYDKQELKSSTDGHPDTKEDDVGNYPLMQYEVPEKDVTEDHKKDSELQDEKKPDVPESSSAGNLCNEALRNENATLKIKIETVTKQLTEQLKQIDDMKLQIYDFNNAKKYADINRFATRKLLGIQYEYNILKEKNADLIHRNLCLTFEKNELYNLVRILENRIYKSDCDIEQLKSIKGMLKCGNKDSPMLAPSTGKPASIVSRSAITPTASAAGATTITTTARRSSSDCFLPKLNAQPAKPGCETDKANLIRQVEFYKNKVFLLESTLNNKNKELYEVQAKLVEYTEHSQLEFQKRYDEIVQFHKNKVAELYDHWKNDYTKLEHTKNTLESELLELQQKHTQMENTLLKTQKEKMDLEQYKIKYQNLQIKYDADKIMFSNKKEEISNVYEKDLNRVNVELKQIKQAKSEVEEKMRRMESLLSLQTTKNEHLREKCRDYWTLLSAKDDQLRLAQKTVENQIIERQTLLKQLDFFNSICKKQEPPSHDYERQETKPKVDLRSTIQLYKNFTFEPSASHIDSKSNADCRQSSPHYSTSSRASSSERPSEAARTTTTTDSHQLNNIISESSCDFTIRKTFLKNKKRAKRVSF